MQHQNTAKFKKRNLIITENGVALCRVAIVGSCEIF